MVKNEIKLAKIKKTDLLSSLTSKKSEIVEHFDIGKDIELDGINKRISLIPNFNLDFFITIEDDNYFINQKFATEQLPFHKSGSSLHLGRFDDISLEMATFRRNPNILNRYDCAYLIEKDIPQVIKGKSLKDIDVNDEIVVDEKFKQTALELFGERIENNLVNIYGMLGEEQTNIIKKYKANKSMWVNGFAGTGKTVIGLELFLKGYVEGRSIAIFANELAAQKANEFLIEVNHKAVATTYREMDEKLKSNVDETFKNLNSFTSSMPFMDGVPMSSAVYLDDEFMFKKLDTRLFNLRFNGDDKSKIILIKKLIDIYGPNPKLFNPKTIDIVFLAVRDYISIAKSLIIDGNYTDDLGKNGIISKLTGNFEYNFALLDETPILLSTPYLSLKFRELTIADGMRIVAAFDEFQYYAEDLNEIWKYLHFDIKGTLSTVYRTTKEIFSHASEGYIKKSWEAPVSISDSFTYGESLEKNIKLSWAVDNYDKLIGLEFTELTIVEDMDPRLVGEHILYMIKTRAVRKLSIIKGYK